MKIKQEIYNNLQILWNYMKLSHEIEPADIIIACGDSHESPVLRAKELFDEGLAPKVLFAGGRGKNTHSDPTTEAERYKKKAIELGLPEDVILIEDRSTNCGENIRFSKEVLEKTGYLVTKVILVHKPYVERRIYATCKKQWPEVECQVTSLDIRLDDYLADSPDLESEIHTLVGDVERIKTYVEKGFHIPQDMPYEVWEAYTAVRDAGFNRFTNF